MKAFLDGVFALVAAALLASCGTTPRAPVIERSPEARPAQTEPVRAATQPEPVRPVAQPSVEARGDSYTVRRGDTLYGIALDNGLDYRELALWNGIADPNVIREGQVLQLKAPATQEVQVRPIADVGTVKAQPLPPAAQTSKPESAPRVEQAPTKPQPAPDASDDKVDWGWPAGGRVLAGFSDPLNKGVDISGKKGEPVFATASGRVVYSGEGLRGYGKLIIVKHNNTYLSAYAHNDAILVKEGQTVTKGQKIGEIGSTGTEQTKLHFEIRRLGRPVDPMKYLPARPS
jgi:lipoprotein NlpD